MEKAELFDTLLAECGLGELIKIKTKYADLPERDPGCHWYDKIKLAESISKKGKSRQQDRFGSLALEHLLAYLSSPAEKV